MVSWACFSRRPHIHELWTPQIGLDGIKVGTQSEVGIEKALDLERVGKRGGFDYNTVQEFLKEVINSENGSVS